jgi:uncharacterized protein (DUF2249 family)
MNVIRIDNRGLTPPEPMVRILAACETLRTGERIEALMDRRPVFLFPELDELGLRYACDEQDHGGFLVTIEQP